MKRTMVLMGLLLCAAQAGAAGVSLGGSSVNKITDMGVTLEYGTGGMLASQTGLKQHGEWLVETIQDGDKAILNAVQQNTTAAEKNTEFVGQTMRNLAVDSGVATAKIRAEETYGENGQLANACDQMTMAEEKRIASAAQAKLKQNARSNIKSYNASIKRPADVMANAAKLRKEDFDPSLLNPTSGTLTPQQAASLQQAVNVVVNPEPPPVLPPGMVSTSAGHRYELLKSVRDFRVEYAQQNIAAEVANLVGTVDKNASDRTTPPTGNGDSAPSGENRISLAAQLQKDVNSFYSDPQYEKELNSGNEVTLLKLLNIQMATSNKIGILQLDFQRQTAINVNIMQATMTDDLMRKNLEALREQAKATAATR